VAYPIGVLLVIFYIKPIHGQKLFGSFIKLNIITAYAGSIESQASNKH